MRQDRVELYVAYLTSTSKKAKLRLRFSLWEMKDVEKRFLLTVEYQQSSHLVNSLSLWWSWSTQFFFPFPSSFLPIYCTSYLNRKNWLLVNEVDFHDFYAFVLLHFFLKILICYFSCKKSSCAFSLNPVKKVGHGRFVYCFIKLIFWAQEKNLDLL